MEKFLTVLHVVGAVFIVGPMAILPQTGMRALRAGESGQVSALARSTYIFSLGSIVVALLGFGVLGVSKYDTKVSTPWVLVSIILWLISAVVSLLVVVPAMRDAVEKLTAVPAGGPTPDKAALGYPKIAASSGVVSLLLLVVVVLMVWKP